MERACRVYVCICVNVCLSVCVCAAGSVLEAVALNDHTQRWSLEKDDKMRPSEEQLLGAADAVEDLGSSLHLDQTAAPASKVSFKATERVRERETGRERMAGRGWIRCMYLYVCGLSSSLVCSGM